MSSATKVIEAARAIIDGLEGCSEDPIGLVVTHEAFKALDAALQAYDTRRAELHALANQATGG